MPVPSFQAKGKADKSAGDVQNRTGRPLEKPQTNVLAQPRENALGKSQSTERRGKDEEDGVVMPGQAQGRREAVLQSVVEERVIEANAARDAQQPEAKQSDNYEKLIRNRDETKIQGTRVSIGTIEVRTVVRQAAPPVVTAPQAQIQGGSHNRGERTGPLTRSLGWRFGLVQG